jgi:5'-3' exoribonuclease 2
MGVPAFYRWLSEKYPKVVQDVLEERVAPVPGSDSLRLPFDATRPNPSGLECDNLYIDMNGIIHPCAHPEHGPAPKTEPEMYLRVCQSMDRLVRAIRPRQLLYLAIDGVAPRAKMNQQRARRFRSAQEARELAQLEEHVRSELQQTGQAVPPKKHAAWDSNVITPGTPFMVHLADYIRFYIRHRMATDAAWRNLRVIFSDASLPGEGEHKIMTHIRLQRSQPGYHPNLVHVLHGLDADLIMLGLATHEAHFYISRELVTFGRKSLEELEHRQDVSGFRDAQRALDEAVGAVAMSWPENCQTPLQRVSIPILREYLAAEFAATLDPKRLPFCPSLEHLLDDIVFLCFFVGNDFLPHLPSLDIRDGALDYLFNVYKRLLPTFGSYITKSGGAVNLSLVDVLLSEVGAIEDHVFALKHEHEQAERQRRLEQKQNRHKHGAPPRHGGPPPPVPTTAAANDDTARPAAVRGRAAKILAKQENGGGDGTVALASRSRSAQATIQVSHNSTSVAVVPPPPPNHPSRQDNAAAAQALKESLGLSNGIATTEQYSSDETSGTKRTRDDAALDDVKHIKKEENDSDANGMSENDAMIEDTKVKKEPGVVGDDEFDADEEDEDDPDVELPKVEIAEDAVDPKVAEAFKMRIKSEMQSKLDQQAKSVEDNVRLHEAGWKDRYYSDKCKADDVRNHGGREHLFRSYVVGLCWVMKYYYDGCPSWKWYYPFHYGPFASDLKNIERFEKDCKSFELNAPFNPVEQLMAVLPSDSSHAIPKESRWLMQDPESPIIDFYPMDVPVDPNGKAMPWLWVVLLPFIDEERLLAAMSSTMTKWEKADLLCNARGLDDGYLYVHRKNPLCKKLATVLQGGKTANSPKTKLTDSAVYGCPGFSGFVRPPLSNELYPLEEDAVIPPPPGAEKIEGVDGVNIFSEPIDPNEAVCVAFTEPQKLSHKSILLPGAQPPPPILSDDDKRIRRPRLNRGGGSIANMGMSNGQSYKTGHGSMNIGSYERNLAQQTGRGHEMNQTGMRAWGAMEPVAKRHQYGAPSQAGGAWAGQQQAGNHHQQQQQYRQNPTPPIGGPPQHYHYPQQQQHQQQSYGRPPQPYQQGYSNQYPAQHPGGGHGYQQQQQHHPPPPSTYQGHAHHQNGMGGNGYGQSAPHQNYNQSYQHNRQAPPAPPQPQNGFNFRSYNQAPSHNPQQQHQQRGGPNGQQPNDSRRSRASADVMSSLRAQLSSTLNQRRGGNGGPNQPR